MNTQAALVNTQHQLVIIQDELVNTQHQLQKISEHPVVRVLRKIRKVFKSLGF